MAREAMSKQRTERCAKCGRMVWLGDLHLDSWGFLWLRMGFVCPACYSGKERRSGGDGG